jgi:acetolactate synthase-1/2/3 large subunit
MGPAWIDVPIDVQAEFIDPDAQIGYTTPVKVTSTITPALLDSIKAARQPLIVAGNGIHLANAEQEFKQLINQLQIPVVCTWSATDLFDYNDSLYVGNFGLLGERAANFAIQAADLLIVLGSRLSIPVTGYNSPLFSPNSVKIMVDIDVNEITKHTIKIDYPYVGDVGDFIKELSAGIGTIDPTPAWTTQLTNWKNQLCVFDEDHVRTPGFVNSFDFIKELGSCINNKDIVVTDMGTSFTCTMQALQNTGNNRLFTSSALCSMGFGLPGAIGAYAGDRSSRVICIAGDGGFQMNIQELQTVAQYQLPIKIILLNNDGYLAISLMQDNLFNKNHFGADSASGVGSPNFCAVAQAYGIAGHRLDDLDQVKLQLKDLLAEPGPALIEINMVRNQLLIPRVQSQRDSEGRIISGSLDAMFPFLSDEKLKELGIK